MSDIFNSLDNSGDRLIEFEEFKGVMNQLKENGWVKERSQDEKLKNIFLSSFDIVLPKVQGVLKT